VFTSNPINLGKNKASDMTQECPFCNTKYRLKKVPSANNRKLLIKDDL
jgi:uncharacterized protein (DUF2225 family)